MPHRNCVCSDSAPPAICPQRRRKRRFLELLRLLGAPALGADYPHPHPEGLGVEIDLNAWNLPPVFSWLAEKGGLDQAEFLKTFNAGIGMVAITSPDKAEAATRAFQADGHTVLPIGRVIPGEGVTYKGQLL